MGIVAVINLVIRAPAPHLCLYSAGHMGPPIMVWLGAPDQGASQGPVRPVGFERERDQPNNTILVPFTILSLQLDELCMWVKAGGHGVSAFCE